MRVLQNCKKDRVEHFFQTYCFLNTILKEKLMAKSKYIYDFVSGYLKLNCSYRQGSGSNKLYLNEINKF